jgi:hypothetical protein
MLKTLFWDRDFYRLTWEDDRNFVIRRILTSGDWNSVKWLRLRLGDPNLREWIQLHRGAGLTSQKLRFWELILKIPRRRVNTWVAAESSKIWGKRANP